MLGINGTIWAVTGVLAVFPLNWISPKLGKRNTLIIAMVLMVLAQFSKIVCYNPGHPYLIIIPTILLSAGMLFFFTLGSSMVGDICDEDELKSGHRSEGSYYAIFWWFIKLGSALASFVAGILITLTMFDEIQVTKVDGLQGNIRELRSKVQYWEGYKGLSTANAEWLKNTNAQVDEAMKESGDYLIYLGKESAKKLEKTNQVDNPYQSQRQNILTNALSSTKSTIAGLTQLQSSLQKLGNQAPDSAIESIVEEAIPLTLQTRLEKSRVNSFVLMSHLYDKSHGDRIMKNKKSNNHYNLLLQNIAGINNQLKKMESTSPLMSMEKELGIIENEIKSLTKQTPYTLLMMRVVEIGLPILLCIFSIFFIIRYSLTEKRSHEIKNLLAQRNRERTKESDTSGEPVIV
jgi:hypothetical protein